MAKLMPDLSISELQAGEEPLWDAYVHGAAEAGFFHLAGWKRVVEKTYGHQTRYLMVKDGREVRGILPLFIVKNRLFGVHVSSTPGAICASDPTAGQRLLEAAIAIAGEVDADDLLLSAGTRVWDGDLVTIQHHCSQRLALPPDPAQLWQSISRHKRKNINKAEREGLSVTIGCQEQLEFFYEVFSHNLRDLGTPVFDKRLLYHIMSEFPEQTRILVVKKDTQPIGSLLLFVGDKVVYAQWAASFQTFRAYRPNDLLYWEMLRWACEQGFYCCDMGRSQWGSGNYTFKELWGAKTYPLYYQYFLRRGADIPDFDLKVDRVLKYRLAVRAWQRLPVELTRVVGPYLRKYLYPL
jgi:FemAB-related protein (PEP-CTERM system-associated)